MRTRPTRAEQAPRPLGRAPGLTVLALLGAAALAATARAVDRRDAQTPSPPALALGTVEPPPVGPVVSLLWFDPTGVLPGGFETARAEVASVFRGIGVHVQWTVGELGTSYGAARIPEVPVILLPDDPDRTRAQRRVMGLVMRDQQPTRVIWVFLRSVRWTLGHDLRRARPIGGRETRELARAVARVVAHELVHAIAPGEPHARGGIMSHALGRHLLLREEASLDTQCATAFLMHLAALLPPPAAPPAAALRTVPIAGP